MTITDTQAPLELPFIGGERRRPHTTSTFPLVNPTTELAVASIPECDAADVDAAVDAARAAERVGPLGPGERGEMLLRWGELIARQRKGAREADTTGWGGRSATP